MGSRSDKLRRRASPLCREAGGGGFSMNVVLATEALVSVLLALGAGSLLLAFLHAGHDEVKKRERAQVWGALGAGLLTGAAVAIGVVALQNWATNSAADALWRASVETAADIPGFSPGNHSLRGLDLSGKQLRDANLRGADLRGVQLRDTDLSGADLTGADLQGDVMYSAALYGAVLRNADLRGAKLQGVQFAHQQDGQFKIADLRNAKLAGAYANAQTCWPPRFFKLRVSREIIPVPWYGPNGTITSPGNEFPHCI